MPDQPDNVFDAQELRRRAIERLLDRHGSVVDMPVADVATLVHELEVYQVELEVQNEELRRAQLELATALARYKDLYDRAPVGYLTLDEEGKVLQANEAAAVLCFRERERLLGQLLELTAVPEDRDKLWLLRQRATVTGQSQSCEFRIKRPSGHPRWVRADISLLRRFEDIYGGFRLTLSDITARVETEEILEEERGKAVQLMEKAVVARREAERVSAELRESEERFHNLADNISQLAWMADTAGARFWFNQRWFEYTGTTLEEMQGWGWMKAHHPDHIDRVANGIRQAWKIGEPWEDTYPLRSKTGEYRWFLGRAVPIRDAEGKIVHWFGTNTDITERERLLSEAQRLRQIAEAHDRAKDEFLALVSHELRTPLAAILGYAQLICAKPQDTERTARAGGIIVRNALGQRQLIDDLLDTGRIISGKLRLAVAPSDLPLLLGETLEILRPEAEAKRIRLVAQLDDAPKWLSCDGTRLRQVMSNLLQNAIKFTPEDGRVELRVEREDQRVRLIVKDTGRGIDPGFLPVIFDRFSQSDMSSTRRHGGLGLGLALAKHLVELHGGIIEAASAGVGQGATFTVTLPLDVPEVDPNSPPPLVVRESTPRLMPSDPPAALPRLDGLRVLVVEDQDDAREMIAYMLGESGAIVTMTASGHDAIELLERSAFDALVCDIAMPDMDGYDLIRRVRSRGFSLPAIAQTALARPEDREQALQAGFQAHLSKPIRYPELIAMLATVGALHRS